MLYNTLKPTEFVNSSRQFREVSRKWGRERWKMRLWNRINWKRVWLPIDNRFSKETESIVIAETKLIKSCCYSMPFYLILFSSESTLTTESQGAHNFTISFCLIWEIWKSLNDWRTVYGSCQRSRYQRLISLKSHFTTDRSRPYKILVRALSLNRGWNFKHQPTLKLRTLTEAINFQIFSPKYLTS